MKKGMFLFCVLYFLIVFPLSANAQQPALSKEATQEILQEQIQLLPLEEVDKQTEEIWQAEEIPSFQEMVENVAAEGSSVNASEVFSYLLKKLSGEIVTQIAMVKKILFVVLLSAILKNLNSSFQGRFVGELGFYVCYMVLIVVIAATFYHQTNMVSQTVQAVETAFQAMMPVFMTLAMASGGYGESTLTASAIMAGAGILTGVVCHFILPATTMATSLEMINHISEKPMLSRFTKLFREGLSWLMKGIAFLFMALLSLQKLGSAVFNQGTAKTAKAIVGSVPIVGDVMGGAVDTAAALTGMLRGGTLFAAVVILVLMCAVPLIRLGIMILIYKITAAVAEPICEARLVKCIGGAGDFSVLLFGALFLVDCMFLFSAVLLLTFF